MPNLLPPINATRPTAVVASRANRRQPVDLPPDAADLAADDLALLLATAGGDGGEALFVGRRRLWHVKPGADGAWVKSVPHAAPEAAPIAPVPAPPAPMTKPPAPARGSVAATVLGSAALFLAGVAAGLSLAGDPAGRLARWADTPADVCPPGTPR